MDGSRIINIDKRLNHTKCGDSICLTAEKRYELASILSSKCNNCDYEVTLESVKGPNNKMRWECNLAAVWGQMTTEGGHFPQKETMGIVGIPVMNKPCFQKTENDIGKWWSIRLQEANIEAGKEERD